MLPCTQQASVPAIITFVRINWAPMCNNSPRPCCCSIRPDRETRQSPECEHPPCIHSLHCSSLFIKRNGDEIRALCVCPLKSKSALPAFDVFYRMIGCRWCVFNIKQPCLVLILHLKRCTDACCIQKLEESDLHVCICIQY